MFRRTGKRKQGHEGKNRNGATKRELRTKII
jgi:hypothetical protein